MRKFIVLAAALVAPTLGGCNLTGSTSWTIRDKDLEPGGVYIAYNLGCDVGCDGLKKGDLIQKMDGQTVKAASDLGSIADGAAHKLEVIAAATKEKKTVEVKATPKNNMPPLKDTPPFWLVGAQELKQTPSWARRRMFGHASPSVMLVNTDGGILDGRQLFGQRRLMVYWDWGDRVEEAAAVGYFKVLQKAQADLKAKNIEVMFVHLRFPGGRKAPMNDSDLRAWQSQFGEKDSAGRPLPGLPTYRFPNETEFNPARELGMENAFTVIENLGESPVIILLDESGIVRWHSAGVQDPATIGSEVKDPAQATVIEAIKFALEHL